MSSPLPRRCGEQIINDARYSRLEVAACSELMAYKVWQLHLDMAHPDLALTVFRDQMRWFKVLCRFSFRACRCMVSVFVSMGTQCWGIQPRWVLPMSIHLSPVDYSLPPTIATLSTGKLRIAIRPHAWLDCGTWTQLLPILQAIPNAHHSLLSASSCPLLRAVPQR